MQSPPNKPKHAASDGPGRAESGRGRYGEARSLKDLTARYLTEPRLGRIPWLIHGFGTAAWAEADFAKVREWNGFRPVILDQVHSDIIHCVDAPPDGRLEGDALITSAPGLFLVVKTADCLPVLVADEARRVVAAVHCGWRGTWKRILEQVVGELRAALRMRSRRRSSPRSARASAPSATRSAWRSGSDSKPPDSRTAFSGQTRRPPENIFWTSETRTPSGSGGPASVRRTSCLSTPARDAAPSSCPTAGTGLPKGGCTRSSG